MSHLARRLDALMRTLSSPTVALTALGAAALAACGGGSSSTAPAEPTGLSGTVAVGAPITNGKLRVLDATGAVVASDVTIDENGRYADLALTGTGPWRLEACGTVGGNYRCIYAVATAAGTANVTPLTTAAVLLAAGVSPDTLMSGAATGLDAGALDAAQDTLRSALGSVLADAGVASDIDFTTAELDAGSRTGYDRVLDAVGVATGEDDGAFVQITPRMGEGNVFITPGAAPEGSLTVDARAANVRFDGVEALFRRMTQAAASATACTDPQTGMASLLATDALMDLGEDMRLEGKENVAQGLCMLFQFGEGEGDTPWWGSRFLSPVLGRCDFGGSTPMCRVSFVIHKPDGAVEPVGNGMAVVQEGGQWKFKGQANGLTVYAQATMQRDVRADAAGAGDVYTRAFAIDIPTLTGLECARVTQRNAEGDEVLLGYFKRHAGATSQRRLSAWREGEFSLAMSSSAGVGFTRSSDDTWIHLPDGEAGDAYVRNFYRGGREVRVQLFGDTACSTPFAVGSSGSSLMVEVTGVPPVSSSMTTFAWPQISEGSVASLKDLVLAEGGSAVIEPQWSFRRGPIGLHEVSVCGDRSTCGDGGTGRLGEVRVPFGATGTRITLTNNGPALTADSAKNFAMYGRTAEGVSVQVNYLVCPGVPAGQNCQ